MRYLKPLTAAVPTEMLLTHKAWSLQGMSLTDYFIDSTYFRIFFCLLTYYLSPLNLVNSMIGPFCLDHC